MLKATPLVAALVALSLGRADQAVADVQHWNWIEVQSISMPTYTPAPAAPGDVAAPGATEPIGLLVPAVQEVREAAARTANELTAERAVFVGGDQSATIAGARIQQSAQGTHAPRVPQRSPVDDARSMAAPAPAATNQNMFNMLSPIIKSQVGGIARATPELMQPAAGGTYLPGVPQRAPVASQASGMPPLRPAIAGTRQAAPPIAAAPAIRR